MRIERLQEFIERAKVDFKDEIEKTRNELKNSASKGEDLFCIVDF